MQMGVNWCNFWGRIDAGVNVVVEANCRGGQLTSTHKKALMQALIYMLVVALVDHTLSLIAWIVCNIAMLSPGLTLLITSNDSCRTLIIVKYTMFNDDFLNNFSSIYCSFFYFTFQRVCSVYPRLSLEHQKMLISLAQR